ncbi:helix-hairpin-helix domain-containing protein [Microvirga sp. W0021]|uniref:Helix-hairpin-helix domain-containing protein n=1 Tax=Hohaiivirga grylli TaxID=3133970 RepID=A0ABV0BFT8_9HYPH
MNIFRTGLVTLGLLISATAMAQAPAPATQSPTKAVTDTVKDAVDKTKEKVKDVSKDVKGTVKELVGDETLIDINSADLSTLSSLNGIGPVRAAAIIAGRPYKGKNDLVKKDIIPESVYNDIKDKIVAKQK